MNSSYIKLKKSVLSAIPEAKKTTVWIIKIIIPVSFIVSLLQYFGIISVIANYLEPLFSIIGLPGESAIVFITSIFLPLYAPIAIATTLAFGIKEMTILAVMCLISHNLLVESAIQRKAGSNYFVMFTLRILSSFIAAYILYLIIPSNIEGKVAESLVIKYHNLWEMTQNWAMNSFWLIIKIWLIISGLIILQNTLKEFNVLPIISKVFSPIMNVMGMSKNSAFLWFIAQVLGLTYGSAVILNAVSTKEVSAKDADLLNYHIAVNHSTLEDTLLFVAVGVSASWMIIPRFILAIFIVWSVRLVQFLIKNKREKAHTSKIIQ